jgi:hypothetical protein
MFTDLAAASAPREVQRRHLFGPPLLEGLGDDPGDGSVGAEPGGVQC